MKSPYPTQPMRYGKLCIIVGVFLAGLAGLAAATNPKVEAFESFAIEQVKTELCPQVPLGLADECPRLVEENQPMLKKWVRQNTQSQNFGVFTHYETNLSVRELVPEPARPLLSFMPLPANYRLQTIGVFGKFMIYGAESKK
jgi:hypothetical protein